MSSMGEKVKLREQGMTYAQIADELGITKQAVAQALAQYNPKQFQFINEEACVYKGLREWMNRNKVSKAELLRRMGHIPHGNTTTSFALSLRGKTDLKKRTIDEILEVTGLTYEIAFANTDAVDVAVVVRCKDCIYTEGFGCGARAWCKKHGRTIRITDFCSFGERKENE